MIQRLLFAIRMGWRYRQQLTNFNKQPTLQCSTILSLEPNQLKADGVSVLALDFDGVLASHGEDKLSPAVLNWLRTCVKNRRENSIFILSNRPTVERQQYIADQLPGVQLIKSPRKKPYPDGLLKILEITQALPETVLVVDDRLLTGILAAVMVGTKARWVTKPFISIRKRPCQEIFFMFLRWGERWLLH